MTPASQQIFRGGAMAQENLPPRVTRGSIHRDLKPDNIFIIADAEAPGGERAKLLDFGIAEVRILFSEGESTPSRPYGTIAGLIAVAAMPRFSCKPT